MIPIGILEIMIHHTYLESCQCTPGQDQAKLYVPVRTSTYWYMSVQDLHTSTYWYVPVRTLNKTCGFPIYPGSSLRVKYNSVQLLCKRYDSMMSNFKKCKVQVIQVHIGTYWYVLVRTCIDINHKHASIESHCISFPSPTSLHCTLDLFLAYSAFLQGSLLHS
jgi:hypothetical protein